MAEKIDTLPGDCKIIQDETHFRFGTDAILLASFCRVKPNALGVDLCSGQGVIALLLSSRTPLKHIDTLEIMPSLCDMAKRSVILNGFEDKMTVHCGDVRDIKGELELGKYDFVVCNPPYKQSGAGIPTADKMRAAALHEDMCSLNDVIALGAKLLKFSGSMFLCQRPQRLADIAVIGREYKMELKTVRFVHSYRDKSPSLVLCEMRRGSAPETAVCPPFILYEDKGVMTEEYKAVYGGENYER